MNSDQFMLLYPIYGFRF